MHFLRCPSCGAKALASASRCPRCTKPFDLVDGRGERMKLRPCRSCEVLLPENVLVCPWCKTEKRSGPSPLTFVAAAIVLLGLGLGWARWRTNSLSTEEPADTPMVALRTESPPSDISQSPAGDTSAPDTTTVPTRDDSVSSGELPVAQAAVPAPRPTAPPQAAATAADPAPTPTRAAAQAPPVASPAAPSRNVSNQLAVTTSPVAPSPTTVAWRPATPLTWINVRSAARVDAPVVRVVRPDEAVQVGPVIAGWRAVRGADYSGWAGARHFREAQR